MEKRFGRPGIDDAVGVDLDLLEERLVPVSAYRWRRVLVREVAVAEHGQRPCEVRCQQLFANLDGGQRVLSHGHLARDPCLLCLEEVKWNRVGQVSLQELLPFTAKSPYPLGVGSQLAASLLHLPLVPLLERHPNAVDLVLGEPDPCVVVLDVSLDLLNGEVRQVATRSTLLASDAEEVVVQASPATSTAGEAELRTATTAHEHAFEVVRVGSLFLAVAPRRHDLLNLDEGSQIDEWLVCAFVLDPAEPDDADVVRVGQHRGDVTSYDWTSAALSALSGQQPLAGQILGKAGHGVLTAGVSIEGPSDEVGSFVIDGDGADLATIDDLADVEVSEGSAPRCAAALGLLVHALDGFGGEIAAVELGDRRHDAVEQHAGWCLVDVLADGDELCAGLLDGEVDGDVVGTGSSESVDLVDDDEVEVPLLGQACEHRLELGTVG